MKLSTQLLTGALVSSLAGVLFGFDTAVISGAEQALKVYFDLNPTAHGFTNAIALIGTIIGAIIAFLPAQSWGRKNSLLVIALLYGLSAIGCALTSAWVPFLIYRLIGGLAVGASSVIAPMYISEIAPSAYRGRLVGLFQISIVLGVLMAFISNYFIEINIKIDAWRWMLGVEAIPAILFFFLTFFIPKSPRWLILGGKEEEGLSVLKSLGDPAPEVTFRSIVDSKKGGHNKKDILFQKKYFRPILLVFLMATFNQFSGINAIMYYAPRIFEMAGVARDNAFLQSISIGLVNMVFTIYAMTLIDKIGRKKLMFWGSIGMVVSLIFCALFLNRPDMGSFLIFPILVFIASFAFSQGAVIWVFISEVFPNPVRATGQSFGTFIHWFWASALTWIFPIVASVPEGGSYAFGFFALAMILQLVFVVRIFPETKGKTLEEEVSGNAGKIIDRNIKTSKLKEEGIQS